MYLPLYQRLSAAQLNPDAIAGTCTNTLVISSVGVTQVQSQRTHCITIDLPNCGSRIAEACLSGGRISSNDASPLLQVVDRRFTLNRRLAACCVDHRVPRHAEAGMLSELWFIRSRRVVLQRCGFAGALVGNRRNLTTQVQFRSIDP